MNGAVQGVGFRPTIYRIAQRLRVSGWVRNTNAGLELEVEGIPSRLEVFLAELAAERPAAAVVNEEVFLRVAPSGELGFEILPSEEGVSPDAGTSVAVLPDLATCAACLGEIVDPTNWRFGYPFTNCTLCGPRFSILLDIPYDRPNTTMQKFPMCPSCRREYGSFEDRRFHAQPNACRVCGPQLSVWPDNGNRTDPLTQAVRALTQGKIVALKGVGGFQLLVDARDSKAVARLRERKHRDAKPFALLMPTAESVREYCEVSFAEEEVLQSQAAPVVLLTRRTWQDLAPAIAENSPRLGVMLPSSPIHHILMSLHPFPLVATSGNLAGEPIATGNEEARERLKDIADLFVLHNRPIARPCDDSVVQMVQGRQTRGPQILRRARGYAPLPVITPYRLQPVLAVGGHLKNTVAIAVGRQVFLSQHIGDLDAFESRESFTRTIKDLCKLYRFEPEAIVSDLHPDYGSTQWARNQAQAVGVPLIQVQHHHAHVAACAAENGLLNDYLGIAWDGAGLGLDGTIWGGEFFLVREQRFERIAHLRPFPLPGGEEAMRDCSRAAAGLLAQETDEVDRRELIAPALFSMMNSGITMPMTSSVGRLFDGVAFLSGVATHNHFEGQAALCLESAIDCSHTNACYEIEIADPHKACTSGNWAPMLHELLVDKRTHLNSSVVAVKFHNALANWIVAVARMTNVRDVVLSGGVFQNAYLTKRASLLLETAGFCVHTHHQVPANDGGLALGQAVVAGRINNV